MWSAAHKIGDGISYSALQLSVINTSHPKATKLAYTFTCWPLRCHQCLALRLGGITVAGTLQPPATLVLSDVLPRWPEGISSQASSVSRKGLNSNDSVCKNHYATITFALMSIRHRNSVKKKFKNTLLFWFVLKRTHKKLILKGAKTIHIWLRRTTTAFWGQMGRGMRSLVLTVVLISE